MEIFRINHLEFIYPSAKKPSLHDINLVVEQGEFITLCGESGCGKSTFLRHLKTVLAPKGKKSGKIFFENEDIDECDDKIQAQRIGFVSQSADNQIVTDKVWHELAFGLESLGYSNEQIRQRVAEMASFFGIQNWFYKNVCELSGGQKQILCLASIMTMQPKVIILDEPTSQLDPIAASEFVNMLVKINRELGITIIISEHRLDEVIPVSSRVLVMENGKIIVNDVPEKVCIKLKKMEHKMLHSMPVPMRIFSSVEKDFNKKCPITINSGRVWLEEFGRINGFAAVTSKETENFNTVSLEVNNIWFKYEKNENDVLKDVSFTTYEGEIYGILGGNGTGKSTLLSVICGIRKAYRGKILSKKKKIRMLPQNPLSMFVKKTVLEELEEVGSKSKDKLDEVIRICRLQELLDSHPYDLSGGEQQRTALAKILLINPDILLLDEPTKGLDNEYKIELGNVLKELAAARKTIILVSHDVEFCAEYTNRCGMFFDGGIVSENSTDEFFSQNSFYTTAGNRMARGLINKAVTANDVISACVKTDKNKKLNMDKKPKINDKSVEKKLKITDENTEVDSEKITNNSQLKRNVFMALFVLIIVPLTIYTGVYYLDNKKYLFIALVVLIECMLPFFIAFEGKSPKARELVMISTMCGICVAGRMAFYMFPEFKPVVALVIISGICMGAETGFMIGGITMLVSNIMFGQGPWTPWQMFALGIVGFLSGIFFKKIFYKNKLNKKQWISRMIILCAYGFASSIVIYGGIMNLSAAIMSHGELSKGLLMSYFVAGFPIDVVRGIATLIFLAFLTKPMLDKVQRVQKKYRISK